GRDRLGPRSPHPRRRENAMSAVLELVATGLKKTYGKRTVVNGVGFRVAQGEVVGLLGPNGAGKSTSFHIVAGLVAPDEGEVTLGSLRLTPLPLYQRARHGLGYLPQEKSIFGGLSVR